MACIISKVLYIYESEVFELQSCRMLEDSSSSDVEICDDVWPVVDLCSPVERRRLARLNNCRRRLSEVAAYIDLCSPTVESNRRTIAGPVLSTNQTSNSNHRNVNALQSEMFGTSTHSLSGDIHIVENSGSNMPRQRLQNRVTVSSSRELSAFPRGNNLRSLDTSDSNSVLSCPICFESTLQREPTVTKCGHVFCRECIEMSLRSSRKCPLCKCRVCLNQLLRIYL